MKDKAKMYNLIKTEKVLSLWSFKLFLSHLNIYDLLEI